MESCMYRMIRRGKWVPVSKKRDGFGIYLNRKKEVLKEDEVIGYVQYEKIKPAPVSEFSPDADNLLLLEPDAACLIEKQAHGVGKLLGYIEVIPTHEKIGDKRTYVAVYKKRRFPLWIFYLYGTQILAATAASAVILTLVIYGSANRTRDAPPPESIPIADTHVYDDSPVPIEAGTAGDMDHEKENDGNVYFNAYSGEYRVGAGDAIPLTNLSENDVYLRYVLKDTSEHEIYTTGLIAPGTQYDFIPSEYLEKGVTDIQLYAECYASDQSTKYPGGCLFDISIRYE